MGNAESSNSALRTPNSALAPRILLVDTVGELGAWWGTATIGFVGGSLFSSRGGQNMIEPAAYGVAVSFGPNTQNFRDVVEMLLSANAAVRVTSGEELTAFVRRSLEGATYAAALGDRAAATSETATRRDLPHLGSLGTSAAKPCKTVAHSPRRGIVVTGCIVKKTVPDRLCRKLRCARES